MDNQISVREMLPDEEKKVRRLYKKSLSIINRIAFTFAFNDTLKSVRRQKGSCLLALHEDRVIGSFSLRIIEVAGQSIGLIDAIVTDKDFRGQGIGKMLMSEALAWFKKKECQSILAIADRYNSSSWNMFIHEGFEIYGFSSMFRDFRWKFVRLWWTEGYFFGFGTYFLIKTSGSEKQIGFSQAWHFIGAWLVLALLWLIPTFREGSAPVMIPVIIATTGLSLFTHELSHKFVASLFNLKTVFRIWETGLLFSFVLALFGGFFPAYGSTYIDQVDWRYDAKQKPNGLFFLAGPVASMALAVSFWVIMFVASHELLIAAATIGYLTNLVFVILNLLPIEAAAGPAAWDGRKIYTWNKIVWSIVSAAVVSLILIDVLF